MKINPFKEKLLIKNKDIVFICMLAFFVIPVFAQTHVSAPLDNHIYTILEHAEMRGLCSPLSGVRPYTHDVINSAIKEILSSEDPKKLSPVEREILEKYLAKFSNPKPGLDWKRGGWYGETSIDNTGVRVSANIGVTIGIEGSLGIYPQDDIYYGMEIWPGIYLNGDIGKYVSYNVNVEGGLVQAPHKFIGEYWTYHKDFNNDDDPEFQNYLLEIYSEPLTHFPYAYKKRWDGSVFFFDDLSGFDSWPSAAAGGYNILSDITASFLENKLIMRAGRLSHDWGSVPSGSSLVFNQMARPFLGFEAEFNPVPWIGFASLTGVLEYNNAEGIKISSSTFQNAFSITMLQLRYKNYLYLDFFDAVVWPKRFELGYISPITNSFFYQNNIGDFDNMIMGANLKLQYPGLGNIWFSVFVDEITFLSDMFTLDRQMFAVQAGLNISLPILSFSSLKLSYTKVNPYCYTHNRNFNPWYADSMETAYANNGVSLGYYLPPNSDEILVRFDTMPLKNLITSLQYQMIRHGADFGSSAVDGSNLLSELDPWDRSSNPILERYFLKDGAYQWLHIIKLGGEWNLEKAPVSFLFEVGTVISYFTNIEGEANSGKPSPYFIIDTVEYPKSTGFIVKLGVRVYPK